MSAVHNKIIAAAAKSELVPLGFTRKGSSRLWLLDHGSWLNIVGFTPGRWSVSVDLDNSAHWIWGGTGFMSFDYVATERPHADYVNEAQFGDAVAAIARRAAAFASDIEKKFASFEAIADHVISKARDSERMRPSWSGYYAGVASGLLGDFGEAEEFLRGITDYRVTPHAERILPTLGSSGAFRHLVNQIVGEQRAALKLSALDSDPF